MAAIFTAIPNAVGRIIYREAGRFISKQKYQREKRRGRGGKFRSKSDVIAGLDDRGLESFLRNQFGGGPIGGGNWVTRVRQSSERFADVLADQGAI
jgi:hypothetical protein